MKKEPMFEPAQIGRASEDIALQIEAAIIEGKIRPGDHLPSERKLQEQFQTGRGVIREALRAMKQKGLIEIKKGARGGAYVKHLDVGHASESLALFLKQNRIDPKHLLEFRESIDHAITTLAIARAGDEEKQQLLAETTRLKDFLDQVEPDMEALGEMDRQLNIRLAQLTHNPVFEWVMRALQLGFSSHDYALYEDPDYREKTILNWNDTAREIADNEPLKAHAFIGYHYVLLRRFIDEKQNRMQAQSPVFWESPEDPAA